jgi:hypothetical protein
MTQILNVTRNGDGQFEITNAAGKLVEGPFETNAAAWKAVDRLDVEAATPSRRRNAKKVLWGKPEQAEQTSKRKNKSAAKQERHMQKAAAEGGCRKEVRSSWRARIPRSQIGHLWGCFRG